jgi:LPS export ABC transporter protein LptC/lipopolysaccharide transport protein LptA
MTKWQRRARLVIGVFVIVFAIVVVFAFKRRSAPAAPSPVVRTDPGAVIESTGGHIARYTLSKENVSVEYDRQLTFADNSTKMIGVRVVTTEKSGGRTFTVTGREGRLGQNESVITLDGDVRLAASDGLTARTEHATYADGDGVVRAAGPVTFARGRLAGTGVGMTYDKNADTLAILDQAIVTFRPDAQGAGGVDVSAGTASFVRRDHFVRFDRQVHVQRGGEIIDADNGTANLTADGNHLDSVDLHGRARMTGATPPAGGLQSVTGDTMKLTYGAVGDVLQHAAIAGGSALQLAGNAGKAGRQIVAQTIDITLAADGSTPTALVAQQDVQLAFPAEAGSAARTIKADRLDAKGEPGRGLSRALFAGSVDYREKSATVDRIARSQMLDVALSPGMSDVDEATFSRTVRFEEGTMAALAAVANYAVAKGTLELSGTEPATRTPRVVNEQITVDAAHIDLTLAGPKLKATGHVQSQLAPPKKTAKGGETKLPSMLKQDQPVNVTADALDYDGTASRALYTGAAQLWQGDTSVKGASITIDDKTGDLAATGPVTTTAMLAQTDKDKKTERRRSVGTAAAFRYEEAERRATYTGGAHLTGPEGDLTAAKIELYLEPSGDELERAEAYDDDGKMSLREQNRTTTGNRLTYTTADDQYVVTGAPVKIVDECQRETTGRTLTFRKATDSIVVDGNGFRTQTKGGGSCPG